MAESGAGVPEGLVVPDLPLDDIVIDEAEATSEPVPPPRRKRSEKRSSESTDEGASVSVPAAAAAVPSGPAEAKKKTTLQPLRAAPVLPAEVRGRLDTTTSQGKPATPTPDDSEAEDWSEIEKFSILSCAGVDKYSRPVMVFSAINLPPREYIDHDMLLRYMKFKFDKIVESDYSIVYFHHGLKSDNKPSLSWLRRMYFSFDRKYKKNLKAMYIVHATSFVRTMMMLLSPILSTKFGRKITFISELIELRPYFHVDQLDIPTQVKDYDKTLVAARLKKSGPGGGPAAAPEGPKTVFGCKLDEVTPVDPETGIPVIVLSTTGTLRKMGMQTEGIFRRSANAVAVKEYKERMNKGETPNFDSAEDIHIPAVLLKSFFRDLPEPVFPFAHYDEVIALEALNNALDQKRIQAVALLKKLPRKNQIVLKYLFGFLLEVSRSAEVNKMTPSNLGIVFGPNLVWSRDVTSLMAMAKINNFTAYLIEHYDTLFGDL